MSDTNMSDSTGQGSSMTGGLSDAGRQTYEQVKSKAMEAMPKITEAAKSQAMEQAETAKDALASTGERLAQSLRSGVEGGDESIQARLMAAAADTVSDWSNQLRGRSFQEIVGQAESFARRNPGAFVAAAALAGFALARFARASAPSKSYGSSGLGSYGAGSFGDSSMGSGLGSGGSFAGTDSYGAGTGSGYGSGRAAGLVSTTGMSTHDDDLDDVGSIADDGMGGGSATTGTTGDVGTATPNSTGDRTGSGYDR
ncbi:hypothetical protein [Rubellimicrobium aerolatum]|uniref:DUF3618 domain-containing protein n=1 Tax=Rubellimicrobium aerolatum TaxID=490979 RepID=A0ABW0SGB0_9RHOB|nr:hypothetical protein [Rubellimicrobium aerolatum]MBP1806419.1 ElaB/YqjD/DUF883 family membrane-anchored ribosome-binding protein [Rubellimicrobium aerolatum]